MVLFGKRSSYMFVSWTADVIAEIWVFYNKKGDLIGNLCWCVFDCNFYYYSLPLVSSNSTSDVWTSFNIGSTKSGLRWRTLKPFQSNISSWRESQFRGSLIPQGKKKPRVYIICLTYILIRLHSFPLVVSKEKRKEPRNDIAAVWEWLILR